MTRRTRIAIVVRASDNRPTAAALCDGVKVVIALLAAAAAATLTSATSHAEPSPSTGIGLTHPTDGPLGLGVGLSQTLRGPRLTLSADLGRARIEIYGGGDYPGFDGSTRRITVGAGVLYEALRRGRVALLVGARVAGVRVASDGRTDWSLEAELPVRLELDATSWLTLHAEAGLSVQTGSDDAGSLSQARLHGAGLFGAIGATLRF